MDHELLKSIKNGNQQAISALIDEYSPMLYNFLRRYVASDDDAADIVQETFFKAWKNIKRYDQTRNFKTWLFTIAKNTAFDHLRKNKTISFSSLQSDGDVGENATDFADDSTLPHQELDEAMTRDEIDACLEKMNPEWRAVIILHYTEEMTFEEISEIMNKPMNTVKSWHRRAIMQLRSSVLR